MTSFPDGPIAAPKPRKRRRRKPGPKKKPKKRMSRRQREVQKTLARIPSGDLYRELARRGGLKATANLTPEEKRGMVARLKAARAAKREVCSHDGRPPKQRQTDRGKDKPAGSWFCPDCWRTVPAPRPPEEEMVIIT